MRAVQLCVYIIREFIKDFTIINFKYFEIHTYNAIASCYCILHGRIKNKNIILSAIKCSVLYLIQHSGLQIVSSKQASCYLFPFTYIDFYHLIHGFTKLSTTVNGYFYCYMMTALAVSLSLRSTDSPLYNIFISMHGQIPVCGQIKEKN